MASRPQRSLKHEYELFVEEEIENYKDSIPRSAILRIGDEAVANLQAGEQTALATGVVRHVGELWRTPPASTAHPEDTRH